MDALKDVLKNLRVEKPNAALIAFEHESDKAETQAFLKEGFYFKRVIPVLKFDMNKGIHSFQHHNQKN